MQFVMFCMFAACSTHATRLFSCPRSFPRNWCNQTSWNLLQLLWSKLLRVEFHCKQWHGEVKILDTQYTQTHTQDATTGIISLHSFRLFKFHLTSIFLFFYYNKGSKSVHL